MTLVEYVTLLKTGFYSDQWNYPYSFIIKFAYMICMIPL